MRKVILDTVGYRVLTAATGRTGLQVFGKNHVDLVMMDHSLPDLDGDALAHRLHGLKPRVPILELTLSGVCRRNTHTVQENSAHVGTYGEAHSVNSA